MGQVPENDGSEDDLESGETGDTGVVPPCAANQPVVGSNPLHPSALPTSPSQPLAPTSQGGLPSGVPLGYGSTDKAEVEVIMNSSKASDGDIARV